MGCTDASASLDSLMLGTCGAIAAVKTIWCRFYTDSLADNYNSAIKDYLTVENAEYRATMRKHALVGRILLFSVISTSYFDSFMYALSPFVLQPPISEDNETLLLYTMPSRCAFEIFHAPRTMHKFICFIQFMMLLNTCNGNLGKICLLLDAFVYIFFVQKHIIPGM